MQPHELEELIQSHTKELTEEDLEELSMRATVRMRRRLLQGLLSTPKP
jgi:hypothetical protein